MDEDLYGLMDWAAMEALVYSESDDPHNWLGGHVTEFGVLYNTFQPEAVYVGLRLHNKNEVIAMTAADEDGNFSVLLPGTKVVQYTLLVEWKDGSRQEFSDPYSYGEIMTESDKKRFGAGIHYEIYEKMGAHPMEIKGVKGVYFSLWSPNSIRVSVVGDFNNWDGRRHQMRKCQESGIFELFIPSLEVGTIYKYELKAKGGLVYLKTDPYGNYSELRPNTASIVANLCDYRWSDDEWMKSRRAKQKDSLPMLIYEVHLGSWKKPEEVNGSFYNYRELAVMLAEYVKKMGYTHIELMPIMEHPFDGSWGYQVTGYFAVTSRYGTPEDFMYFMDYMHQEGIGVILDWVPAHFPRDTFSLSNFDGTCLYEHLDPRKGAHPHWGTLIFNYGRPQVINFLIASALFWINQYHVDGIRMDAVASMLYLDYGKNDGEWVANIYGGNENLEAVEFLKHINSVFHKQKDGAILIAEESTAWPKITDELENGGLGFDYKWNMGWMNDFTGYMKQDPIFRKGCHGALTFSMIYAYSEKFVLVFSHDEVVHGKGSMINKMPGEPKEKFSNLRLAYGFMAGHPGRKLLFMGQEFAQLKEWNEEKSLDWDILELPEHSKMQQFVMDLNHIYKKYPAFYELDYDPEGFKWISCLDADHSIVSFVRKTAKPGETLLMVFNFTPVSYKDFVLGVPFPGKYKEIFNSDKEIYGGDDNCNPRMKQSKKLSADGWDDSIKIVLAPLGMAVFTCTPMPAAAKPAKKRVVRTNGKSVNK